MPLDAHFDEDGYFVRVNWGRRPDLPLSRSSTKAFDLHQGATLENRMIMSLGRSRLMEAKMPVQSGSGKASQRPDQIGARIRARRVPEALATEIGSPEQPVGMVILPVTVPLSASSGGLRRVAAGLQDRGFATFLAELLSPAEWEHGYHNFDFEMLAGRIAEITESLRREAPFDDLPIGYFGTSTDAAAMAIAAAQPDCPAGALVMCNARPDLASIELPRVHAPTLFILEDDELALDLNRSALAKLGCRGDLAILRGMGKGLASPEIASNASRLAGDWFETHLRSHQDS